MPSNYAINVQEASQNLRHYRFCLRAKRRYTRIMRHRLKELRKSRGWTQKHVADLAGMSVSYYADIERGDKQINETRLRSLAKAFDTTVNAIMIDEANPDDAGLYQDIQALSDSQRDAVRRLIRDLSSSTE